MNDSIISYVFTGGELQVMGLLLSTSMPSCLHLPALSSETAQKAIESLCQDAICVISESKLILDSVIAFFVHTLMFNHGIAGFVKKPTEVYLFHAQKICLLVHVLNEKQYRITPFSTLPAALCAIKETLDVQTDISVWATGSMQISEESFVPFSQWIAHMRKQSYEP